MTAAQRERIKAFATYAMIDLTNIVQFRVRCCWY